MTILTLMTSPGMLTQLRASVTTDSWHLLSSSIQHECLHVVCIPELVIFNTWIMPYYDTQHSEGKVLWERVLSSAHLPNPLHHVSDIRIYINSSAGPGIMSLFLSPMTHLVDYEDQDVCHEFCICRNYWPVCCADWVSWPSVSGPPPHSCLQMFLITPSVPSQLSTENLWPRNRPRMLRERFRRDIRAGRDGEHLCVCQNLFCNVFIFH